MSPLWRRRRPQSPPTQRLWDPARTGPSLLDVVAEGVVGDAPLPDDPHPRDGGPVFAPGALAGGFAHHTLPMGDGEGNVAVRVTLATLDLAARGAVNRGALLALYDGLLDDDTRVQPLIAQAVGTWARSVAMTDGVVTEAAITRAVRQVGSWLVLTGRQRGPVRTGITLLSMLTDLGGMAASIATLGRHAELTLDASSALGRAGPAYEPLLLDLARAHTGWGRVHAAEQLSRSADREVHTWLLSGGFRNDVMWEYLACEVCVRCDLAGRLAEVERARGPGRDAAPPHSTRPTADLSSDQLQLLDGARDLLVTLLSTTGPSGDVEDYLDAARAATSWLRLTASRDPECLDVRDLRAALRLHRAVHEDGRLTEANGFSPQARSSVRDLCVTLLAEPSAVDMVLEAQDGSEPDAMAAGSEVAQYLGIDMTAQLLARVRQDPDDPQSWWLLVRAAGQRPDEVVAAALDLLPADGIARDGRATIGPAPGPHLAVGIVLQEVLTGRPGLGWPLLERCLRSPLVGHRNQAVTVLLAWPSHRWPHGCVETLQEVCAAEQDAALRARIASALDGAERADSAGNTG